MGGSRKNRDRNLKFQQKQSEKAKAAKKRQAPPSPPPAVAPPSATRRRRRATRRRRPQGRGNTNARPPVILTVADSETETGSSSSGSSLSDSTDGEEKPPDDTVHVEWRTGLGDFPEGAKTAKEELELTLNESSKGRISSPAGLTYIPLMDISVHVNSRDPKALWISAKVDLKDTDEVFQNTQLWIRSVMDGYNVCIFACRQTGSHKTHSKLELTLNKSSKGRISSPAGSTFIPLMVISVDGNSRDPKALWISAKIDLKDTDEGFQDTQLWMSSVMDGYNVCIFACRQTGSHKTYSKVMKFGEVNQVVISTAINNSSSRSHSVLTVHVHGKDTSGGTFSSFLHLVDLGGSDLLDKSEVTGDWLKESQFKDKYLSCVGDLTTALALKNSYIPDRKSKLTVLLQVSLGRHAKTLVLAHVSPEKYFFSQAVSTLKFAQMVTTVELGAADAIKECGVVMQLKEQIDSVKKTPANKEAQGIQFTETCNKTWSRD